MITELIQKIVVFTGAATSLTLSWIQSLQWLGAWDKVVSIVAGTVAIIVGIFTIVNYLKEWSSDD